MGFLDFFKPKPTDEELTSKLVNFVYNSIETKKGVRVEDAICLISTIVAERCIVVANDYCINEHEFEAGAAVFSEKINEILVGPVAVENWSELPKDCVFGMIKSKIESNFAINGFPELKSIFEKYAQSVGHSEWGKIALSVPEGNKPFLLPLQVGYESRTYVDKNINQGSELKCLHITINALARILIETKMALDPSVALTLTFELINGMSKTATMTDKRMAQLVAEKS